MANYLFIIATRSDVAAVESLFDTRETTRNDLDGEFSSLFVSASGNISPRGDIFKGWSVDFDRGRMAFPNADPDLWPSPRDRAEGSFFRAERTEDGFRICSDFFALSPLLWTKADSFFAFSDSLYVLTRVRKALDLTVTPYEPGILARRWVNSMGQQQFGTTTVVEEINYSIPGTTLTVDLTQRRLDFRTEPLASTMTDGIGSHETAVVETAQRMIQMINGIGRAGAVVNLGLSGGTDSRIVLAAALAADIPGKLAVGSQDNGTPDFAIAHRLSNRFGFPLNKGSKQLQGRVQGNDQLAYWTVTSMGLYDPLYAPSKLRQVAIPVFQLGGHGAEAMKGNYGWRGLDKIDMPQHALQEARAALEEVGIDPRHRTASEWHYLLFRNPIHGSRATGTSELPARPTLQKPGVGLSRFPQYDFSQPLSRRIDLGQEVLIALSPDLALADFDKPAKNMSFAQVREVSARLLDEVIAGGAPEQLELHGTPEPNPGPTLSFLTMAAQEGLTGATSGENLTRVLADNPTRPLSMLDGALQTWLAELDPEGTTTVPSSSHASVAAGKALSSRLFA